MKLYDKRVLDEIIYINGTLYKKQTCRRVIKKHTKQTCRRLIQRW